MSRKLIYSIILVVVLMGVLGVSFNVHEVEASGTIYIKADGSVEGTTYLVSEDNVTYTFTADITDTIVVQRNNIIIDGKGHTLQGSGGEGFYLAAMNNVTIRNTNIKGFGVGIQIIIASHHNTISGNNITTNGIIGIQVGLWDIDDSSNNNIISGNNISATDYYGIYIGPSTSNNTISGNNIRTSFTGIHLLSGSNNSIVGNNITNCGSGGGIHLESSNNTFYHNNFIENVAQVIANYGSANVWDDGYPSGGNYWSDHSEVDLYWGPYQNLAGSDGIGDNPYVIDASNSDNYPLMSPYEYWSDPILGDINKDMKVDHEDLSQLATPYGSTSEKTNWNPNSDFNGDDTVDVLDLFNLGKNYGKTE